MSVSLLNRSCCSPSPLRNAPLSAVQAQAPAAKCAPAQQPRGDLWQKLMTDAFESSPRGAGVALGGPAMARPTEAVSKASEPVAAPLAVGGAGRAAPSSYVSDAGPGFGAPSAGANYNVNEPWLSVNNTGSPYNSNMQLIEPGQKGQFKFTNTFTNDTNAPQTITLWNKVGEKGGPNDGQNFDKSTPKTFTLQPGESQIVAFDNNSSVAWCASKDGSAKPGANSGQTWGEATFGNAGTGWSGYNTSQISPAGHNGNMSITNEATGKTVTQANAWQTEQDDPAGKDVGVPAGPMNLRTVLS
ncbi:hypothetical protein [Comamonas sp. JC664]|uniref:hypothetical protein n=1 Tax=Comamonas sp. JC664 TaxID=2801917 RepID=UPI00174BFE98|nr:hypothetical protein [Comamonas sp. JC664]MBL0697984.1 hypothetical protein [Comamonas sp. JC664]